LGLRPDETLEAFLSTFELSNGLEGWTI